jgi:hypothetical protein
MKFPQINGAIPGLWKRKIPCSFPANFLNPLELLLSLVLAREYGDFCEFPANSLFLSEICRFWAEFDDPERAEKNSL